MRTIKITALIIAVSLFTSCDAAVNFFAFYPDNRFHISPENLPSGVKNMFITTEDGKRIQAYYFSGDEKGGKLLIYFHGNAGNLNHRIDAASKISAMGCDVLLVSYRGYAQSEGRPSEKGIYLDGKAALNYAIDSLGFPPEKIFLFGRSIGSTVGVHTARGKNLAGVILITPLSSGRELAASQFGILKFLAGRSFESIEKINDLKSPLLIIHGTGDEIIPIEHGLNLYNAYSGRKKLVAIEGANHNNLDHIDPETYYGSIKKFLNHPIEYTRKH